MADELDWNGLRLLLEVSRAGSLHRAGETLGLAASTVSRRISALEERIGSPLLDRGPNGCRLTSAGSRLAELAGTLARDLDRIRGPQSPALVGTLCVSAGDGFIPLLCQTIARFTALHPACAVDLLVDDEFAQVSRGEADVALRMSRRGEPSLVYRRLAAIPYGFYCAPALLERIRGRSPSEVPFVGAMPPMDRAPQHQAATAAGFVETVVRTNSFSAQLSAVRAGLGVAALPRATSDGLEVVFAELPLPDAELFAVTRASGREEPHVVAFLDVLRDALE